METFLYYGDDESEQGEWLGTCRLLENLLDVTLKGAGLGPMWTWEIDRYRCMLHLMKKV